MDLPIHLKTEYATKMFHILNEQHKFHRDTNLEFRRRCKEDLNLINKYFTFFLESDNMMRKYRMEEDELDSEGWRIHNELSELSHVLQYFSEKLV